MPVLFTPVRMTVKISNYNTLRAEVDTLRARYRTLQRETTEKDHQLASLQVLAREVHSFSPAAMDASVAGTGFLIFAASG